jgi:phosphatidylglycerol:prolipoprotein diacylglycerol transferase
MQKIMDEYLEKLLEFLENNFPVLFEFFTTPLFSYWEPLSIPLGPISVHGFGILVAMGFMFGSKLASKKAARDGFDPDLINRLVGWLVLGVFVGGHLGHLLFYFPEDLVGDGARFGRFFDALLSFRAPSVENDEVPALLQVWHGLSSYGGFLACTVLTIWFFRKEKVSFWPYADALAYGLMVGWMLGRLGCFSAHDHPGTETSFFLGVKGMCPVAEGSYISLKERLLSQEACHDLGLYEALWSGAMFGWFWLKDKLPRHPGYFLGWMCLSYGPIRLIMDIYRHPVGDTRYFGLTPAQYGSVLVALIGAAILLRKRSEAPLRGKWTPEDSAEAATQG